MVRVAAFSLFVLLGPCTALAAGDPAAGKDKALQCAACHGIDGNSANPVFPKLAGQHAAYLARQLRAFRDGTRPNPMMAPLVPGLSDRDIDDLAAYFAAQTQR